MSPVGGAQTFIEHFAVAQALRAIVEADGGWDRANYYVVHYLADLR